ncbi:hypothetical protein FDUTEX481_01596 [Tolypothrix sp. PCC 7601]|nr:hypothetical protein FDUTEX481_01596 [Tolypothrix sp. PCC 7601]
MLAFSGKLPENIYWSFVICHLSFVIGHWSLLIGYLSLVIAHWLFVICHWSFGIGEHPIFLTVIANVTKWSEAIAKSSCCDCFVVPPRNDKSCLYTFGILPILP